MSFSEAVKRDVKRRAHFQCCLCRSLGVEVHHVVPQSEGGPDVEENAAPLCPSCHETYGANPEKRKFIREARELWYEICVSRYGSDSSQLEAIKSRLDSLATKEDIARIAVRSGPIILGQPAVQGTKGSGSSYKFDAQVFVHPRIVQELLGWISDRGPTVIAVDVDLANNSNRFYGKYLTRLVEGSVWVDWEGDGGVAFGYSQIAVSPSGVHMVNCYDPWRRNRAILLCCLAGL